MSSVNRRVQVKSQGCSIQYHGHIDKVQGQELYHFFVDCICAAVFNEQCACRGDDSVPQWFVDWKHEQLKRSAVSSTLQSIDPSVPPEIVFRSNPNNSFGGFDGETGFPLTDAAGEPLTKSATKKLRKLHAAHAKRHTKWKEEQAAVDVTNDTNGALTLGDIVPSVEWKAVLDPSFCCVMAGTFGKRQSLEFRSDMGPFCHVLQA